MQAEKFCELLGQGAAALGVPVDIQEVEMLFVYFSELKRWSRKVNLIARETDDEVAVEKHFVDSLALLKVMDHRSDYLLDVGSGAGFPGLVCRIARPRLSVDLMEPRLKRVSFLRHIVRTCGTDGVEVFPQRLETGTEVEKEDTYTCITSRAVTDIAEFLGMCRRFNGKTRVICVKGPKFRQELDELTGMAVDWKLVALEEYRLPFSGSSRALLVFE